MKKELNWSEYWTIRLNSNAQNCEAFSSGLTFCILNYVYAWSSMHSFFFSNQKYESHKNHGKLCHFRPDVQKNLYVIIGIYECNQKNNHQKLSSTFLLLNVRLRLLTESDNIKIREGNIKDKIDLFFSRFSIKTLEMVEMGPPGGPRLCIFVGFLLFHACSGFQSEGK